jgi:hypothetical protein
MASRDPKERADKGAGHRSQRGSHRAERLPTQANGYGQPRGDHVSSRTDPDDTERLTVTTDLSEGHNGSV